MTPAARAATALTTPTAVRVAVAKFFGLGFTRGDDLHIKGQRDARERVIPVEQHLVAFHAYDRHDRRLPVRARLKLFAKLDLALDRQKRTRHALHLRRIAFAVGLGRRHVYAGLRPRGDCAELLVQPVDDLARAFEVGHGLAARGTVEHVTLGVTQGVVKGDNTSVHKPVVIARNTAAKQSRSCNRLRTITVLIASPHPLPLMHVHLRSVLVFLALLPTLATPLIAEVRLPAIFGAHMVLQQDVPLPVWGTADAGETVTVRFGAAEVSTTAAADGSWRVTLPPQSASATPQRFTVGGRTAVTFDDVLVGEVWLASGQSNMAFPLSSAHDADEEVPRANDASLRLFVVTKQTAAWEQTALQGRWEVCTPATARGFSAVAYFFGRDLRASLGRPVGLINSSWGGTPIQTWLSLAALRQAPPFTRHLTAWEKAEAAYRALQTNPSPLAAYRTDLKQWQAEVGPKFAAAQRSYNQARANGDTAQAAPKPERPEPVNPDPMAIPSPSARPQTPSVIFNAMIAPLAPYALRGGLWYQGEANVGQAKEYETLLPRLIADWRARWGAGEFPFLVVQLPGWARPGDAQAMPDFRDAQRLAALRSPHTALAVTHDLGDPADVHPAGKRDVGLRLARLARADVYGETLVSRGPTAREVRLDGQAVRLRFDAIGSGLTLAQSPWRAKGVALLPTNRLVGFELRGSDGAWRESSARIDGQEILVHAETLPAPTAVRYAWAGAPRANLYNRDGLPAAPFLLEIAAAPAR